MVADVEGVFVAEVAGGEVVFGFEDVGGRGVGPIATPHFFGQGVEFQQGVHGGEPFFAVFVSGLAFFFALGFSLFAGVFLLPEAGDGGAVIIAAEAGEFAVDFDEADEAFLGVDFVLGEEVFGLAGEFEGEEGGETVAVSPAIGGVFQDFGLFGEAFGEVLGVLEAEPVLVAALFPFAEVGFVDGAAAEVFGQDGLDFGEGVEPVEDFGGGLAVFEAVADLFAEGEGEAGDFAAGHGS